MAKICSLFSGSEGNCVYIEDRGSKILVDAGVSAKRIKTALAEYGISPRELDGILITHGHGDHIGGLFTLSKQFPAVPIIATEKTLSLLAKSGKMQASAIMNTADRLTEIGNFGIESFDTLHDIEGSCGYKISLPSGSSVAVCTDLGVVTDTVRSAITGCRAVLIESNHDIAMLQKGLYPPELKRRISSDHGHLSNTACASELPSLVEHGTVQIILAHLSRENNRPEIAHAATTASMLSNNMIEDEDYKLSISNPFGNPMISF